MPCLWFFVVLCLTGLGVPISEDASIAAGGVLAREGVVLWWLALASCTAGVLAGDVLLYLAGRRWGDRVMETAVVRRLVPPRRRERLAASYCRHGVWIVFGAHYVPGLRTATFLTAGIARIPFLKFLAADGAAVGIAVPFTFALAYLFADQVHRLVADMRRLEVWIAAMFVAVAAMLFIGLSSLPHLRRSGFSWRSSMNTVVSRLRRFFFPAVTVILGTVMLAIPWVLPFGRVPGRMAVFIAAGIVELVLGMALAYLVLHDGA